MLLFHIVYKTQWKYIIKAIGEFTKEITEGVKMTKKILITIGIIVFIFTIFSTNFRIKETTVKNNVSGGAYTITKTTQFQFLINGYE